MKITELKNLYSGYNKDNDFRILIAATCESDAYNLAYGYGEDAKLDGEWEITPAKENMNFDCDYTIV